MNNHNKNHLTRLIVFFVAIAAVLAGGSPLVLAQEGARVYPQQAEAAGQTVTVDIMADNVTSMYGAEFRVKYDPAILAVQDAMADQDGLQVQPGTLLPVDKGFVVANDVNEAEGLITFAVTLLRPAEPVDGSGPLARIAFNVLQEAPSAINVEHAKLVSIDPADPSTLPQTIPSQVSAMTIGPAQAGDANTTASSAAPEQPSETAPDQQAAVTVPDQQAEVTAPDQQTPATTSVQQNDSSEFPWWILAVIILVLGLLLLGAFVLLGGQGSGSPAPSAPNPGAGLSPTRPTGGRPSAFKPKTPPADLSQEAQR